MTLELTRFDSNLMGAEVTYFTDIDFEVDGIWYRPTPGNCRRLMFEVFPDDGRLSCAHVFSRRSVDEDAWLATGVIRDL